MRKTHVWKKLEMGIVGLMKLCRKYLWFCVCFEWLKEYDEYVFLVCSSAKRNHAIIWWTSQCNHPEFSQILVTSVKFSYECQHFLIRQTNKQNNNIFIEAVKKNVKAGRTLLCSIDHEYTKIHTRKWRLKIQKTAIVDTIPSQPKMSQFNHTPSLNGIMNRRAHSSGNKKPTRPLYSFWKTISIDEKTPIKWHYDN